jgi:hypothetical protein
MLILLLEKRVDRKDAEKWFIAHAYKLVQKLLCRNASADERGKLEDAVYRLEARDVPQHKHAFLLRINLVTLKVQS